MDLWGRRGPAARAAPCFVTSGTCRTWGLELGVASRSPPSCYGVRERGCSQQSPGTPQPPALPHPQRRSARIACVALATATPTRCYLF